MQNNDSRVAWLHRSALQFLSAHALDKLALETGGVLLGYFAQPGQVPVILSVTGPGPKALHHPKYYRPDSDFDELQIATLYDQSGGKITYLGDWHTHVAASGALSYRDRGTIRRIATCSSARVETPIMLIFSYDKRWPVTIWQGYLRKNHLWRRSLSLVELKVRVFD